MELNKRQKEIVETTAKKVVVLSAAASGKTRTLTERAKYLLKNKIIDPKKMVIITFTNAAAQTMKDRLDNYGKDVYIGTIHSYANYLLLVNGINTNQVINEEKFDALFPLIKNNLNVVKEVDYLLLDEAQDSTEEQFEFILEMIKPKQYMFFGDHRQSIYGFRGASPDTLFDLSQLSEVTTYRLNQNYRNGRNILNFSKRILNPLNMFYHDDSICCVDDCSQVIEMSLNVKFIIDYIKAENNYNNWFILARYNSQVDYLYNELIKKGIPCDTFKKAGLSNEELEKKMKDNTVKVLTIHTAKGLEADNVVVVGASFSNNEERRVSYVAATRARELLIWCKGNRYNKKNYFSSNIINWE